MVAGPAYIGGYRWAAETPPGWIGVLVNFPQVIFTTTAKPRIRFSMEQLEQHFTLIRSGAEGTWLPWHEHPALRQLDMATQNRVLFWLTNNTDYVQNDPTDNRAYVRHFRSLEDISAHPEFGRLLEAIFGNGAVLEQLILSPQVQASVAARWI